MTTNYRALYFGIPLLIVLSCTASRVSFADDRPSLPPEIERTLAWLPEETLVAAQSFLIPSMKERYAAGRSGSPKSEVDFIFHLFALQGLFELEKGKHLEALAGKKVILALNGARNFDVVSSFGSLRSEACAIVVLEKDLETTWIDNLRVGSKEVRQMSGRDVFVYPSSTVMEPWVQQEPWQGTFTVVLKPNTLLCATSDRFLERILKRVDSKPVSRALPDHLPEWKHLDLKASNWMLRHIPGQGKNITGLTLSTKRDGFQVDYLPQEKHEKSTLDQALAWWNRNAQNVRPDVRQEKDGTTVVWSNDSDPFVMHLYHLQGHSGVPGIEKNAPEERE